MKWIWSKQTILLTGGSDGIGKALARELAEKNATIILVAWNKDRLVKNQSELSQQFPAANFHSIAGDIGEQEDCNRIIDYCKQNFDSILSMLKFTAKQYTKIKSYNQF